MVILRVREIVEGCKSSVEIFGNKLIDKCNLEINEKDY
jgi:hypothetical protein